MATEAGHFSDLKIDPYSSVCDWIKIRNTKKVREYGTELHPTTSATILTADLVYYRVFNMDVQVVLNKIWRIQNFFEALYFQKITNGGLYESVKLIHIF